MDQQLRDGLKAPLVEQLNFPLQPADIREETSLVGNGLGLDSVDVVSLMVKVEDTFDVLFGAEDLAAVTERFGTLAAAIEGKVRKSGAPQGG
jgi:acyl carrier protein